MNNDEIPPESVVAVIGAGAMGAGIAQVAAQSGHEVLLFDAREGAARAAVQRIGEQLKGRVDKGKTTAESVDETLRRLRPAGGLEQLAPAKLLIEAIVEDLAAKQSLFTSLEAIVDDDAILATNTSSISITAIGAQLRRPERLVGMHFFNPAVVMPLVEVVSGAATSARTAGLVYALAERWGKTPVHARSTPGFIVNRLARPFYSEALRLLQEGVASAATLDEIVRVSGGFRMGPFELMDLIGLDVNYSVTRSVFDAFYGDPRYAPSLIQLELVNAGFLGRKSGRGFFDYADGATKPDPDRAPVEDLPGQIELNVDHPFGRALASRLGAAEIPYAAVGCEAGEQWVAKTGAAILAVTDGRSASRRAREEGVDNMTLMDLMLDPATASGVAIAHSARCTPEARSATVGLLQAAGLVVYPLVDSPGLAVMRIVAMLANEACDAVHQRVCTASAADIAMRGGVNYPIGPIAWADRLGVRAVLDVVDHLHAHYAEPKYRASPRLRHMHWSGEGFYD